MHRLDSLIHRCLAARLQVLFPLCCSFVVERAQKCLRTEDLVEDADGNFPSGGDPDEITMRQLSTHQVLACH